MTMLPHRGVAHLDLCHFRCYEHFSVSLDTRSVVLTGPNGAGKTNLLESLSFLIPGRGLRRAPLAEVRAQGTTNPWAISVQLTDEDEGVQIGTGLDPESPSSERRITKINGERAKSQSALTEWVSVLWLTPQMDRLFMEGSQGRRRFLDRLVYGFDPGHAQRLNRYEKALKERNLLLRQGRFDNRWLESLEEILVKEGIALTLARQDVIAQLSSVLKRPGTVFPQAELALEVTIESEEELARLLHASRAQDKYTGRTSVGPHRSDLSALHPEKNQPAALCSTGEQKALLLSIVMASAHLLSLRSETIPLLLLDEVVAHLDKTRRSALFDELLRLKIQTWLTGTDVSLFEELQENAQFLSLSEARLISKT